MAQYKTVLCEAQDEFVEKRSRFIGYAKPVQTEEEALAFIAEKRSKHWDATHNVYAYILRSGPVGDCQRPLRASTPQGERVALAHSETVPEGSTITFEIHAFTDEMAELARECMDYGEFSGIGQWRNSGKGRFLWQELE